MVRDLKYVLCVIVVLFVSSYEGKAQRVAVFTDAFQYALLSPNLGFEVALSQHHAFAFSASTCPVKVNKNLSITHLSVLPEYKYWFRMPFYGHYAGASMMYSSYEAGGSIFAGAGNLIAAFADYGYSFILGRRWNVVPHAGIGVGLDVRDDSSSVIPAVKIGVNIQMVIK